MTLDLDANLPGNETKVETYGGCPTGIDVALWTKVLGNTKVLRKPSLDDESAEEIVRQLIKAKTPLMYVGGAGLSMQPTA